MIAAINSSKLKKAFTIKIGNTSNRSVENIKILLHKTCILAHHPLEGTVSSEETSVILCCSWAVEAILVADFFTTTTLPITIIIIKKHCTILSLTLKIITKTLLNQ